MFVPNDVVTTVDVMVKVEAFLKTYRNALIFLRKNQPEEWAKQIRASKDAALKTADVQDVVEMIAICHIEYECCLKEGTVSPLVKNLNAFMEANHIKMGE